MPLHVLFRVSHAVLWRELAAVDVTLIREEGENLMVHNRVLGLHQLAGFLVTDAACRLVMPECLSGLLHESRPTVEVLAILHVLGITEENLLVIADVGTEVALVPSLRDGTLFDDSHGYSSPPSSASSSIYFQ